MMQSTENNVEYTHQPIMPNEVLEGLKLRADGVYIDATFGCGGHAKKILGQLNAAGRLWVLDRDPDAIVRAKALRATDPRLSVLHGAFGDLGKFCKAENLMGKVNGILLDLGVSSPQLDNPARGFSFRLDGILDMRMDPQNGVSALDWLNTAEASEIAQVLKTYGEERFGKRIAQAIVTARTLEKITSTVQLAEIISRAHPAWEKSKHPATRSFQAIRIWVNNELEELSNALSASVDILAQGGRLVVISFHSLEHRLVKRFIQQHEKGDPYPVRLPFLAKQLNQKLRRVGRAIRPSVAEVEHNRRARSAVLRMAEKIGQSA